MKIILTSKPNFKGFSIEAGKADNKKHFDHHGQNEYYPSPCNNKDIKAIGNNEEENMLEITHMDADTLCGIKRLLGEELPKVNLNLMEQIDNNGSSVCSNKFDPTLLYMIGVEQISRNLKFPRVAEENQNVTKVILEMLKLCDEEFISMGRITQKNAEKAYMECLIKKNKNKVLFSIDDNDALDPSRAYEDGIDIVVVYRKHYKSISIYCNPSSEYVFGGKTVAGIAFGGHPKACGSPRGEEMTEEQANKVWETI